MPDGTCLASVSVGAADQKAGLSVKQQISLHSNKSTLFARASCSHWAAASPFSAAAAHSSAALQKREELGGACERTAVERSGGGKGAICPTAMEPALVGSDAVPSLSDGGQPVESFSVATM